MFPLWLVIILIVLIVAGAACAAIWLVNQPGSGYSYATPFGCLGIILVEVVLILVVLTVKGIVGWSS